MKYIKNFLGSNIEKKVIFSTDDNPFYYFFMPIVSKLWVKIGYQPHIFVVGSEKKWLKDDAQKQLVLNASLEMGADIVILDSEIIEKSREFEGYNCSAMAQVSRLCSPCWPSAVSNDYYLTSDIDMLPLNRNWFNQQNPRHPIHVFYANGYKHTRYAICYLGMNVDYWKRVIQINTSNIYVELMKIMSELRRYSPKVEQWGHDETFFFNKIKRFSGYPHACQMIDRIIYKNPVTSGDGGGGGIPEFLPMGRIDRSNWDFTGKTEKCIDAHCKRPGYKEDHWRELRHLFSFYMDSQELTTIDQYYKRFTQYV